MSTKRSTLTDTCLPIMQALWQLTMYVILLYLAMSAVLALLLYPAYVHSAASFAGDVPEGFSPVVAIFCMSLGALTQTSVSISELSPASYYTIAVVTMGHFYGTLLRMLHFTHASRLAHSPGPLSMPALPRACEWWYASWKHTRGQHCPLSGWGAVHLQVPLNPGPHTGIIMSAAVLGALINRASIPQARVVFSDNCLFSSRNGEPVLMFRIGNTRGNFLLNPEIRIGLLQVCFRDIPGLLGCCT